MADATLAPSPKPLRGQRVLSVQKTAVVDVQAETKGFFTCLAEAIVEFFRTGRPPVDAEESIELIRFIEVANESRANGGREVAL